MKDVKKKKAVQPKKKKGKDKGESKDSDKGTAAATSDDNTNEEAVEPSSTGDKEEKVMSIL